MGLGTRIFIVKDDYSLERLPVESITGSFSATQMNDCLNMPVSGSDVLSL